jgi:mono/diheme cytochrome c family protein
MKIEGFSVALATMLVGFAATAYAQTSGGSGSAGAQPTLASQTTSGAVQTGQKLFHADGCWECHGTVGQGGGFAGPRIAPMELPWSAFVMQLRTPQNNMPPFGPKVLATADAANIYAYLKSIPQPPDVKSIPLLN